MRQVRASKERSRARQGDGMTTDLTTADQQRQAAAKAAFVHEQRPWVAEARRLHDEGVSYSETARRLGLSLVTVWNALNPERAAEHRRRVRENADQEKSRAKWRADYYRRREQIALERRERYAADPEAARAKARENYARNREREKARLKASRQRQPEKTRARVAVHQAIQEGRLEKLPCEVCGTTERVEAHHDDYSRRLDVRWLCTTHHGEVHRVV